MTMVQSPSLFTFYRGWETYQRKLGAMIAPLSPEQLALPTSSQWTIGMTAQHMVSDRVWWFQEWMGEGSPELAPIAHWDPNETGREHAISAPDLVDAFERTWQMIADALASWTPDDLEQIFQPPASVKEEDRERFPPFSRQWMIWHVLEHEIHHGGEISLALGNNGLAGVYGSL